jgi:acid phosphatase type 7
MDRRHFLMTTTFGTTASIAAGSTAFCQDDVKQSSSPPDYSDYSKDPRPDVAEGTCTAGSLDGPVFKGFPVVSGPSPDAISIMQPLQRMATGYLEYSIEDDKWQRVYSAQAGMLQLSENVLKFHLPTLPPGRNIDYRIVAHSIGWIKVRQFYHGEIKQGQRQITKQFRFRTLDPDATTTKFVVWNDTHENAETIAALHTATKKYQPDFLLWNGDQSNDCHFENAMAGQFLNPAGLSIADAWPLAYVRGNHECRGPAARALPGFTGSPDNQFYYGFRSGPLAAIVMDTGEDKPDNHPHFCSMAHYESMQREQAQWLNNIVQEKWFQTAPHKVLFCHIPLWFHDPQFPDSTYEGHRFCRDLWAPTLIKAKVNLVISGHTHKFVWMPHSDNQPIAQLTGGSPNPASATFISGTADANELNIRVSKLDGTTLADLTVPST